MIYLTPHESNITIGEAIDHLMPEFALRDKLRRKFGKLRRNCQGQLNETYFATIVDDILQIIAGFLPDLRQGHGEDPLRKFREPYRMFVEKYTPYNRAHFGADHISHSWQVNNNVCYIKNHNGAIHTNDVLCRPKFVGNNKWITEIYEYYADDDNYRKSHRAIIIKFPSDFFLINRVYFMPCGLVLLQIDLYTRYSDEDQFSDDDEYEAAPNPTKAYTCVINLNNNQSIFIANQDKLKNTMMLIDDFGAMLQIALEDYELAQWSDITSKYLKIALT